MDGRGGGGPFPGTEALPDMTEEQIVDRYHQHTKHCPSCSVVRVYSCPCVCHPREEPWRCAVPPLLALLAMLLPWFWPTVQGQGFAQPCLAPLTVLQSHDA